MMADEGAVEDGHAWGGVAGWFESWTDKPTGTAAVRRTAERKRDAVAVLPHGAAMAATRPRAISLALAAVVLGLTLCSLLAASPAHAETCTAYTWVGPMYTEGYKSKGENDLWTDETQWSPHGIPGSPGHHCDSVTIKPTYPEVFAEVLAVPAGTELQNLTLEDSQALSSCPYSIDDDCGGGITVRGNLVWRESGLSAFGHTVLDVPVTVEGESALASRALDPGESSLELSKGAALTLEGPTSVSGNVIDTAGSRTVSALKSSSVLTLAPGALIDFAYLLGQEEGTFGNLGGVIENLGAISVPSGAATVVGEFSDKGSISTGAAATLDLVGVTKLAPADDFTGTGKVLVDTSLAEGTTAFLANNVTIGAGSTLVLGEGATLEGTGTFTGSGSFSWSGALSRLEGDLSIGKSISTTISGAKEDESKTLQGTLGVAGVTTVTGKSLFGGPTGRLINTGDLTFTAGTTVTEVGLEQEAGSTHLEGATLFLPSGKPVVVSGGGLGGHGAIEGDLLNSGGTVQPSAAGGQLTVSGSYTQGPKGTLNADIEGTAAGNGFGQLVVDGAADLAGMLNVTTGSFTPIPGSPFPVVTYASRNGCFSTISGTPTYSVAYEEASANVIFGAAGGPFVGTTALPEATRGTPYHAELMACGGTPPYKWKKLAALPKKLKLGKTGLITGTPSTKLTPGTVSFSVQVSDTKRKTATGTITLNVG